MADKLKPCPFCGSKRVRSYSIEGLKMIGCQNCCARSSLFHKKEQAVESWNKRVDSQKHGKWIVHFKHWSPYQQCSVCGFEIPLAATDGEGKLRLYKYCPECATRLEGSDDDASD